MMKWWERKQRHLPNFSKEQRTKLERFVGRMPILLGEFIETSKLYIEVKKVQSSEMEGKESTVVNVVSGVEQSPQEEEGSIETLDEDTPMGGDEPNQAQIFQQSANLQEADRGIADRDFRLFIALLVVSRSFTRIEKDLHGFLKKQRSSSDWER